MGGSPANRAGLNERNHERSKRNGDQEGDDRLYHEALEGGWVLVDPDADGVLFASPFGADEPVVSLTLAESGIWLGTTEGDVTVDLVDFKQLPSPKAAAEFIALLR